MSTSTPHDVTEPILYHPDHPPRYTIDLSLPPSERYVKLATDFRPLILSMTGLFDDVVGALHPRIPISLVRFCARLMLRRVYSAEETAELRGISKVCGIRMFLLVALNTFLDALMGCTSGGVRTKDRQEADFKMLHFRTLDWGMDVLRRLIVQLEFVNEQGGGVIARSITYAGYVGVLTGVRRGLSMSLNFRPNHNDTSFDGHFRFYSSQLLVLLGLRPSISSIMRKKLLDPTLPTLQCIGSEIPFIPSTAAYLIFSDGEITMVLEKDHLTATLKRREDFIVVTNHDLADENQEVAHENARHTSHTIGATEFLIESMTRKLCVQQAWQQKVFRSIGMDPGDHDGTDGEDEDFGVSVKKADIIDWLEAWPVTNESTHYTVIMDPKTGKIVWLRRLLEPVDDPLEYSSMSDDDSGS